MAKKNTDDFLDGFFNEISNDLNGNESVEEFAKRVHTSVETDIFSDLTQKMNDSLHKSGYDNLGDLINYGMDTAMRYVGPKAQDSGFEKPSQVVDAFTYIQNELANVRYEMLKRGAYKDGHQEALRTYFGQMEANRQHVLDFQKIIKNDMKARKKRKGSRNERFEEGYIEAMEELIRIVKDAKVYMMQKVKADIL